MDSEDRFYATLFLGFGAAQIWCARDLARRGTLFGALLVGVLPRRDRATDFVGAVGSPSGLFTFLGGLELALPPLLWFWFRLNLSDPRRSGPH